MAWLTGWAYRKLIPVSRASGAVTNYQYSLLVGQSSGAVGEQVDCNSHCLETFDDLRFTTSNGTTLLKYWIESISGASPNKLANLWIKFDSVGTSTTNFYMYYGKADAPAVSSHIDTMIKADDGATGNFTEATANSGYLDHSTVPGYYMVGMPAASSAAIAGTLLSDLYFASYVRSFGLYTGAQSIVLNAIQDSATVANLVGDTTKVPLRRFYVGRYNTVYSGGANRFIIIYVNAAGTSNYWDGDSWTTSATLLALSNSPVEVRIWSDNSNFYADILAIGGSSLLTAVATIAVASVKSFSSGRCLMWGEARTDFYAGDHEVQKFFIRQYRDPEPAYGSFGPEETPTGQKMGLPMYNPTFF
jgi:hypothetical protein